MNIQKPEVVTSPRCILIRPMVQIEVVIRLNVKKDQMSLLSLYEKGRFDVRFLIVENREVTPKTSAG